MAKLVIDANRKLSKINKEIQGQFSEHLGRCIYEGLYVGENSDIPNVNGMRTDVVEALKNIKVPVLRWPGGCFADEYHWKDGIGPKESRKKMINTNWSDICGTYFRRIPDSYFRRSPSSHCRCRRNRRSTAFRGHFPHEGLPSEIPRQMSYIQPTPTSPVQYRFPYFR